MEGRAKSTRLHLEARCVQVQSLLTFVSLLLPGCILSTANSTPEAGGASLLRTQMLRALPQHHLLLEGIAVYELKFHITFQTKLVARNM